jgi:hypothetical protein
MASRFDSLPQEEKFHAPLQDGDTAAATVGCRHTSPDICRNNSLNGVCAFVRPDCMCLRPPKSWAKQYEKLVAERFLAREPVP